MNDRPPGSSRIVLRFVLFFIVFAAVLFGTAGTLRWWQAWVYLVLQFSCSAAITVWLKKRDPVLLKDRLKFMKSSARPWDKVIMLCMTAVFVPMLLLPGLDFRYHWSHIPAVVQLMAFAGLLPLLLLAFAVMRENTYLSRVVELQKERGHKVITTGPYAVVRHPFYLAAIVMYILLPLGLGSYVALIPAAMEVLLFVLRTALEDRMLQSELEGYSEYARNVRYRLVPGIW